MSKEKVVAIGIDALPPELFEKWCDEGVLPTMNKLRDSGVYGKVKKSDQHPHDGSWLSLYRGKWPQESGEWGHTIFDTNSYEYKENPHYKVTGNELFFSDFKEIRTILFDTPLLSVDASLINVIQIQGWGIEENQYQPVSNPQSYLQIILNKYGKHPLFGDELVREVNSYNGEETYSMRIPSIYDYESLQRVADLAVKGLHVRANIIVDLIQNEQWDLFITTFGELHYALHLFWHLSFTHPLFESMGNNDIDKLMLKVAKATDEALEFVLNAVPKESELLLFSVSGMRAGYTEINNHLILPEFLYRLQFGQAALAQGDINEPLSTPNTHYRRHWKDEVWDLRTLHGEKVLESPFEQEKNKDPMDWSPSNWYRRLWPTMKAFALPNYSHGMIRVNVKGREKLGIVDPAEYEEYISILASSLEKLSDSRTGKSLVKKIIQTRINPLVSDITLPEADLIVIWDDEVVCDSAQSDEIGRIGVAPYFRTGGHHPEGFYLLKGACSSSLKEDVSVIDLSSIILELLKGGTQQYMNNRLCN